MENPIILILYFFEPFCITTFGGVLFGYSSPQNIKTYTKVSLITGLFLYFIRNYIMYLDQPIVWHIPLSFLFLIATLYKLGKFDKLITSLIVLSGYIVVMFNESVVSYFFIKLFQINTEQFSTNVFVRLELGLLNDLAFVLLIGIVYYFKKYRKEKISNVEEVSIRVK